MDGFMDKTRRGDGDGFMDKTRRGDGFMDKARVRAFISPVSPAHSYTPNT
jgi:hypothetical protein